MFGQTQGQPQGASGSTNTFGGSLFGQNNNSTSGNSLFSSQGTSQSTPQTTGTGLFGQKPQQQSGGLFSASGTVTGPGGLFAPNTPAPATSTTPSLFGQPAQGTQNGAQNGINGVNTGGLSQSKGLFGSNTLNTATNGTAAPAMGASTNSLFAPTTTPGLGSATPGFGSTQSTGFGSAAPTSTLNAGAAAAPAASSLFGVAPLYASIDAPAFDFLNSVPSPKLYTSLSKRREIKEAVPAAQPDEPQPTVQPPKRKFMNDYKEFMDIRPTNLHIKRQRVIVGKSRAPRAAIHAPAASATASPVNLFNGDITTVKINKKALEQGYYMRPSLDELIGYSRSQLKKVSNFIVGRTGFGQIEYPDPVDLSSLANLGDIMGTLVVFTLGAVSVYPEESKKAEPGCELNKPAVVTIEQIYPRNTSNELLSPSDPRMGKFVEALKKKCTSRGAEFLTFTQGVWVFKVPHFSTWGLDLDEMIVDEPLAPEGAPVEVGPSAMVLQDVDVSEFPSTEFASAVQTSISNKILPFLEAKTAPVSPKQAPLKWGDLLGSDNVLRANRAMIEASPSDVRKALFKGASINTKPQPAKVVKPTPAPTPLALETLEQNTKHLQRKGSDVPLLVTSMTFRDLMAVHTHEAWGIAALLFDNSQDVKSLLSTWLSSTIGSLPATLTGLDAVWWLVASHRLEQAVDLAISENHNEIAITIAGLGQNIGNAQRQLAHLKATNRLDGLSEAERKIYEIAAGNFDHALLSNGESLDILAGLDWKQRVGVRLWYGQASVSDILQGMQATSDNNTELAMLKLAGGPQNLSALLELVDVGMGFLMLQALGQTKSLQDEYSRQIADKLYNDYSLELLQGDQLRWAVFVAMHSSDNAQALRLVEQVLARHPTFNDVLIPRSLVAKALARHAHSEGRFLDETNLLLECNPARAKQIYLEQVAPRAVLANDLDQLAQFDFGGVYQDYLSYTKQPSDKRAQVLASSIRQMPLDSLVVKAAAAQMSHAVASSMALSTAQVLELPLHEGVASMVCKRAYTDLGQLA